ncbi:MAG: flagellin, partial [Kordiimonas sp.]
GTAQSIGSQPLASSAVINIESSIQNVNTSLSALGARATRLDLQKSFISQLRDTIEVGIGNLVDADMARASADLQALQVKQQLGLQALSIANQAPQSVLSLFN